MGGHSRAVLIFALLVMFITASLSIGCGGQTQSNSTFTYAEASDPASLDPALVDETVGGNIIRYLFDGLVAYDSQTSEVKPAVAESWESNSDATEFTFHLKSGVKFSDGSEVSANDFVYSWTRALAPATMSSTASAIFQPVMGAAAVAEGETDSLSGVQALDNLTLRVTLEYPMADFVSLLGHPVAAPVSRQAVENKAVRFAEQPTGNGPYRIKAWTHDDRVILEKNPDYYGNAASLDEVTVRIIPDPSTAVAELKAGNIDAVRTIPPGQMEALRNDGSVKFYQRDSNFVRFLGMDVTKQPFDNQKLRNAIAYAIDVDTIADKVLQGQEFPADGIVPTSVPGYQGNASPFKYDPEKSKTLLADAGFSDGQGLPQITLNYPGVGAAADAAQAIQSELRAVGIPLEIAGLDEAVFMEEMTGGNFSLFLISWEADAPNMDGYLFPLFDSNNIGATDVFQYNNPEVDELLSQARSNTDSGQRISEYNDAERRILSDAPVVPITFGQENMIYGPRVTKFIVTPLGDIAFNEITVSNQ